MIFLKKYMEKWYFLQMFWKNGLSKKNCTGTWSFLYYLERWYFFYPEIWYFFFGRKMEDIFLKKHMEIWYFLYICVNVTNTILPFGQKSQRQSSPDKMHLKVIGILDWHSRNSSSDSLHFYGDLHRLFYILLSSEKKTGNVIYRIEIWLLFQFIWLEIFYNEEYSTLCTIQPSGVVFRGVLERQLRKLFVH